MTITEPDRLLTIILDGPDGPVLALHGPLSPITAPGVDSLLTCMRDSGEPPVRVDLRAADVDPEIADLLARRWGIEVSV